jgi:hypothetical protein
MIFYSDFSPYISFRSSPTKYGTAVVRFSIPEGVSVPVSKKHNLEGLPESRRTLPNINYNFSSLTTNPFAVLGGVPVSKKHNLEGLPESRRTLPNINYNFSSITELTPSHGPLLAFQKGLMDRVLKKHNLEGLPESRRTLPNINYNFSSLPH